MKPSFSSLKAFICFYVPVFASTYKNMKKFMNEIFKHNRLEIPDAEEASHIEGCVNPMIQDKYNLTHKNSSVDYSDMLLPLTKNAISIVE